MSNSYPVTSTRVAGAAPSPRNLSLDLNRATREVTPALVEIWRAILYRRWWILGAAAAAAVVAAVFTMMATPQYRSTALVVFESGQRSRIASIDDVFSTGRAAIETSANQIEFLRSRDVAMRVIRELELDRQPEFDPMRRGLFGAPKEMDQEEIDSIVLERFQRRLQIEPVRLSQLVRISFESADRQLAAQVANEMAAAYIQADLDAGFAVTERANEWLNARLSQLKSKLDQSEAALQTYREQAGLVDTPTAAQGGNARQFEELNKQLVDARVRRTMAEQPYNQVREGSASLLQVSAVINNPAVQRARGVEIEAARRFNEAAGRFGSAHPAYVSAEQDLRTARETTLREAQSVAASIRKEYEAARAAEVSLERTLAATRGTVQDTNRKEIQQGALQREVEVNRQLYNLFLSRQRETSVAADFRASPARVIDPAVPALNPFKPNRPLIVVAVFALALLAGAAVAAILSRLDQTIKRADDLEEQIGWPLVAAIPRLQPVDLPNAHRMTLDAPESHFSESIRSVAAAMQLLSLDSPRRIVLVTSAAPGEGKSTIASNLALTQARLCRTLLIEADLRRPVTAARFGLSDELPGLTDFVSGSKSMTECVHGLPFSDLWVMPSGRQQYNAAELFATKAFRDCLEALADHFEMVIIDCAPVRPVADAQLLSRFANGVLFVAAANKTPAPLVRWGIKKLTDSGARVFGVVLNLYDKDRAEKYYGDYSSYSDYSELAKPRKVVGTP